MDENFVKQEVDKLVRYVTTHISDDTVELLQRALDKETSETAKSMLSAMLENQMLSGQEQKALCQSPGFPTVYVRFGDKTLPGNIADYLGQSLVRATNDGLLRPSIVHPLTRKNSGNNSGQGVPNIEYKYIPDLDYLEVLISLKGCGAELGNAMKVMTVPMLGENFSGLKDFVLRTVIEAGGKPCPPVGIGIGIGGQMDVAAKLSREAISTRKWTDTNPDPLLAELEEDLLTSINNLKLGAAGTGGDTYALAVKIGTAHTHTAIAPVAINFHCWVTRRAGIRLYNDGRVEKIL